MARTKISEYSATSADNTDIGSVNIAEGCAPSGINNAIRILMSQLKNFQTGSAGDSVTVGGNLSVAGTSTLTGAITATAGITGPVTTSSAAISGGTINGAVIGGVTPQAITGTTITANTGFVGGLTGNVTGNLTGNSAGTHTGAVVGNVTGDVTGNVTASSGTTTLNNLTVNGTLDMDSGSAGTITGLATPSNATDAATKAYVDAVDTAKLNLSGGTMSGNIAMGGNKVTGLGTPTSDADAVTKAYVDAIAQGIDAKASCRVATTANITLSGTQTIDGVAVIAGDRVLVKDQTTTSANGIYVVASGSWTRATDADAWTELVAAYTFVESGTANAGNGFLCTVAAGGTLGTTAVTFTQFSGAGQITAGSGLTKTGNQLDIGTASSARIVVNSDNIDLATTGVSASTYKSVTVDTYGRVTAGTNPTTISGFGITDAYTKTEIDTTTSALLPKAGGTMTGNIVMGSNKVTSTATPTTDDDLTRKAYVDSILGSATSAATSAAAAATSATNAQTSATNASTYAGNALASANAAEAAYDSFDDRYLGSKSSAPTVDNDGNALLTGAIYWNSTSNTLWVWNGSAWSQATLTAGSFATLAGTETLTNKTLADLKITIGGSNGTLGQVLTSAGAGAAPTWATPAVTAPAGSTGQVQYNNAGAFGALSSGTSGQVLTSQGSGAAPAWATPAGGAWTYISTTTASSVASVNIEEFTSTYDVYVIIGVNITTSSDQNIAARMKYNGSYLTYDYFWQRINNEGNTTTGAGNSSASFLPELLYVESASTNGGNLEMQIFSPSSVSAQNVVMSKGTITGSAFFGQRISIGRSNTSAASSYPLTGIQIFGQGGSNFSGTFRLYGIKNS